MKKRIFRRKKKQDSVSTIQETTEHISAVTKSKTNKKKNLPISYDEEIGEEKDIFIIKKSKGKRRGRGICSDVSAIATIDTNSSSLSKSQFDSRGEYTPEKIAQLQENTVNLPAFHSKVKELNLEEGEQASLDQDPRIAEHIEVWSQLLSNKKQLDQFATLDTGEDIGEYDIGTEAYDDEPGVDYGQNRGRIAFGDPGKGNMKEWRQHKKDILFVSDGEEEELRNSTEITDRERHVTSASPPEVSVTSIKTAIHHEISKLKEFHLDHSTRRDKINVARCLSEQEEVNYSKKLEFENQKYLDFQEIKDRILDVLDFLANKNPLIEHACEKVREFRITRAEAFEKLLSSRFKQEADDLLKKEEKDGNEQDQIDAFGRDLSAMKKNEKALRQMSRAKWKQNHFSLLKQFQQQLSQQINEIDRWDIDDELAECSGKVEAIEHDFSSHLNTILSDLKEEFAEVSEEYLSLDIIQLEFELWNKKYPQLYRDAWCAAVLPSLFTPYVQLECLDWFPLSDNYSSFDSMKWYIKLFNYGNSINNDNNNDEEFNNQQQQNDDNLIPNLVEKVIVPLVRDIINYDWNPFNKKETISLDGLIQLIICHVQKDNSIITTLQNDITLRLKKAINSITPYINDIIQFENNHIITKEEEEEEDLLTDISCLKFKITYRGLKLFSNILIWQKILSNSSVLRPLSLSLFVDVILPFFISYNNNNNTNSSLQSDIIKYQINYLKWIVFQIFPNTESWKNAKIPNDETSVYNKFLKSIKT